MAGWDDLIGETVRLPGDPAEDLYRVERIDDNTDRQAWLVPLDQQRAEDNGWCWYGPRWALCRRLEIVTG